MKLDFALYTFIAAGGAFAAGLGNDEAAKFVEPETLFWLRLASGVVVTTATAAKAYTSRSFGRWMDKNEQQTNNDEGKQT